MQSHQFHNLHGNREATESCESWVLYTEGRRVEQETKQHVNQSIYSMDMQTPPRPPGNVGSRRWGLQCSEADIEYELFTVSHILTALQTRPGRFVCIKKKGRKKERKKKKHQMSE